MGAAHARRGEGFRRTFRTKAEKYRFYVASLQKDFAKLLFCEVCDRPILGGNGRAKRHEECHPPTGDRVNRNVGPHSQPVIARELESTDDMADDPWCPELANGACCHCGQPAKPEWLVCAPCLDVFDDAGKGSTPVHYSVRKAYR